MSKRFTRRTFIETGMAAAVGGALAPRVFAQSASAANGLTGPKNKGATVLGQFKYSDVELLQGPMREQFRANHEFFLALDEDGLLKPFRQKAGLPAPGPDMGGWYSWSKEFDPPNNMTGYIPGHSFGQYLSGLARDYGATRDEATKAKIHRLVQGFAKTITPKFYEGYPLPCYTFDKTNCGLIDAHEFAGCEDAMPTLAKATDAVMPFLPAHALTRAEMRSLPHPNISYTWDESYTLPENFFIAWKRSGDKRYLDLAKRFLLDKEYFDPLAAGDNVIPHKHAYSHINALCSAMQAYLVLGSEKHLKAAENGFRLILEQSYATGGWGPNEAFVEPGSGDLGKSLTSTHSSFETGCGSYGHFKTVRYLMEITGEARFGDSMEKVLYNTVLGAWPVQPSGFAFYYSDYNNDGSKFYYPEEWPCCSGTFSQVTADYGVSSYFRSKDGVAINLFVPSRLKFRLAGTGVTIEQQTRYPYEDETTVHVTPESPRTFTVALRVPAWAGHGTSISINGKRWDGEARPGSFASIHREWKPGDRIEYTIDRVQRLEPVDPQHPNTVALMAGPLSLFGINSPESRFTRAQLLAAKQSGPAWKAQSAVAPVAFKAFPDIHHEKTRLYYDIKA